MSKQINMKTGDEEQKPPTTTDPLYGLLLNEYQMYQLQFRYFTHAQLRNSNATCNKGSLMHNCTCGLRVHFKHYSNCHNCHLISKLKSLSYLWIISLGVTPRQGDSSFVMMPLCDSLTFTAAA